MYHKNHDGHNAKPIMYRVALRLTAGATPKTLAKVLEKICTIGPEQSLLWANLLLEGPFHYGCMTKDVAESIVSKIEYGAKTHHCPLHASIEPISIKTT